MKKLLKFLLFILIVWTCLAVTNPTIDDYKRYVASRLAGSGDDIFTRVGRYVVSETAAGLVERHDFVIFSGYVIRDPFGREYRTIGILKMFFEI